MRALPAVTTLLAIAGFAPRLSHAAQPEPGLPADAAAAAAAIAPGALAGPVAYLASDLLEGRGPASRGDALARAYIASAFESLGLKPGAAGSWEQPFRMIGIDTRPPGPWAFAGAGGEARAEWHRDYIATAGIQKPAAGLERAEVVFAGYGIVAPEFQWDDFKGAPLAGKVLLVLNNDPDWSADLFAGKRRLYYGRWTYKYESAARAGAAAAIIIHTTPSAGYPWQVVQSSWTGEQFDLPSPGGPELQVKAWVTEETARRIVALAGKDLEALTAAARERGFRPVPLGVTTSLRLENAVREVTTANVLGLLPGRDPKLRDQAVIYSAHHDHLGIGEPDASGDTIYNGAGDNACGVAQMLAIARAYVSLKSPPRRSILFLAVGAEESGLLGSAHYAAHPTFLAGNIAANVNFDGGNIWGRTRDVTFIGHGKSSLDRVAEAAARLQGRKVVEDQFPDRGFYYRSDQFSFAKIGVPAMYFDVGTDFIGRDSGWGKKVIEEWEAKQYHQPSDEVTPDWNYDGMVEDARLGFLAGLMVAEADALPAWNPGDEFEPARKKALAEATAGGR